MEKEEDHLPPSSNNQGIDLNLSLGPNSMESSSSKDPTFLTEELILGLGTNSIESSSKNSTVLPEELQLRLGNSVTHGKRQESQNSTNLTQGANLIESSSKNPITHESRNNLQFPSNTVNLDPQLQRKLESESELELAVMQAKQRERLQEKFAVFYEEAMKKLKSAKIAAIFFKIGSWKWISKRDEDLVAKMYYKHKKLIWEFLYETGKKKIEITWSNISAMDTLDTKDGKLVLKVELNNKPQFFQEINFQPRKKTSWGYSDDFTNNQASIYRQHIIVFEPRVLEVPFNNLLHCDEKLQVCCQGPFPRHTSHFFDIIALD